MQPRTDGTMLVAIYHIISGFLSLLGAAAAFALPAIVGLLVPVNHDPDGAAAIGVLMVIGIVLGVVLVLITAANWAVAWGLWKQQAWARLAAIVLAVFRLFNMPLGTIAGSLIIWHLLRPEVKAEFVAP